MPFEFFFPRTFYYRDQILSEADNAPLVDAAYALRRAFPRSTRPNLYTTYGSLADVLTGAAFAGLRQVLTAEIALYLEQIETRGHYQAVITDSWISISAPGNYERMHTHGGCYASGVYYIKTSVDCGRIFFEIMDDNLWASARSMRENWNVVSFEPRERRIILFNSQIPHHVAQNMSQSDRIALSFNVVLE